MNNCFISYYSLKKKVLRFTKTDFSFLCFEKIFSGSGFQIDPATFTNSRQQPSERIAIDDWTLFPVFGSSQGQLHVKNWHLFAVPSPRANQAMVSRLNEWNEVKLLLSFNVPLMNELHIWMSYVNNQPIFL